MTDISVVIPTIGQTTTLPLTVASLAAQDVEDIVIVIDGPPTDPDMMSALSQYKQVRLLPLGHNQGVNRARAHGIAAARHPVIVLLDDDIIPHPGFVNGHRQAHDGYLHRVAIGYIPVALPKTRTGSDLAAYEFAAQYEKSVQRWRMHPNEVLAGLWAGNVSARRDLFARIEFPPLTYFEDLDMGLRLAENGGEGVFLPHVVGTHHYSKGIRSFQNESVARGHGAAQLEQLWGEIPAGIVTNVHGPQGVKGAIVRILSWFSAIPGIGWCGRGLITAAGWCRLWRAQSWLAGVVRLAIERQSFLRARKSAAQ